MLNQTQIVRMRSQFQIRLNSWLLAIPLGVLLPTSHPSFGEAHELSSSPPYTVAQTTKTRRAEADRLLQQGELNYQSEHYEVAAENCKRALATYRAIQDYYGEIKALMCLGHINFIFTLSKNFDSSYNKAIDYYQQALSVSQSLGDKGQEADIRNRVRFELSSLVVTQADREERKGHYSQALNLRQKVLTTFRQFKDIAGEAGALVDLGSLYSSLGQYRTAISCYQQALGILHKVGEKFEEAKVLANLGIENYYLENYQATISFNENALLIYKEIRKTGNSIGELYLGLAEAVSLSSLGDAYYKLGQYRTAITFYQQAEKLSDQGYPFAAYRAHALLGLGDSYLALVQYNAALNHYQKALQVVRETGRFNVVEGRILSKIGDFQILNRQPNLAIAFYKQSVNIYEMIREDIRRLPREFQESYTQSVASTYRMLADLLIQQGRLPEAQAVLELLKLRELRDFTRDAGINSSGINLANVETTALKEILQRYTTVGDLSQKIDACEQSQCPELKQLEEQRDQLNAAVNAELNKQRAILAKYFSTESGTLTPDKLTPEARDIVNEQPGTVLIYPLILKDKIQFLLALKAGDGAVVLRPVETPNVSAETLFKTIQNFREKLQTPNNLAALKDTSQQLYKWLIKPLEPEINNPAVKHLVFAPDSTTRYIPLAALFDGKRYLIERFSISTITAASETDTSETFAQLAVNNKFVLAAGASTFARANPLENVPAELSAIVKSPSNPKASGIYPGVELLNAQFDYEALKTNLKGRKVLHIATHGKFQPGRPEDSYLLPGRGEKLTTALIDQLGNYGLKGIHLVVLSACETAVGDRASDGIEIPGISYFFLKNKVRAVMASLWSVNDASTSLMMQQFYKQLAIGKTKAEALQTVQQQFITGKLTARDAPSRSPTLIPKGNPQIRQNSNGDFSHPYYWAPFILIGNSL